MANDDRPRDVWNSVAASLRTYQVAQAQTWGGLDEMVVARFLAGTATTEEQQAVTTVAEANPAVAELLAVVRDVFAESPAPAALSVAEAARQKKVSEATLRAAVESGELAAVRTDGGYTIPAAALAGWEPKSPPKPTGAWTALAASTAAGALVGGMGGAVLAAVAVGAFALWASTPLGVWQWTVRQLTERVIPYLRRTVGNAAADAVAAVVAWADGKVVLTRQAAIMAGRAFSAHVLRIEAAIQKTSATTVIAELATTVRTGETSAQRVTIKEENIPLDEIPAEVRERLIRIPTEPVALDIREMLRQAVIPKAAELGVTPEELELAH